MKNKITFKVIKFFILSVLAYLFLNIKNQNKIFPYMYRFFNIDEMVVYRSFRNILLFIFLLLVYFITWKVVKNIEKTSKITKILYSILSIICTLLFVGYLILSKTAIY